MELFRESNLSLGELIVCAKSVMGKLMFDFLSKYNSEFLLFNSLFDLFALF